MIGESSGFLERKVSMNIEKKKISNVAASFALIVVLLLSTTVGVFAASYSSSFDGEWYTGNGGSVNGASNGAYHKLGKGTATINYHVNGATSTYPVYVQLKRAATGIDINYGKVTITNTRGSKNFPEKTDVVSSKYYIIASAGTHDTKHRIYGTLETN